VLHTTNDYNSLFLFIFYIRYMLSFKESSWFCSK